MRTKCLAIVLLAGGLASIPASADRASAEYYGQRGDKALEARDWSAAKEQYERALEEDATYLPARNGLAEADLGAGDRPAAIEHLRRLVAEGEGAKDLAPPLAALVESTRRRLADMEAADGDLARIAQKHVDALLSFADRWASKDPDTTAAALREVLRRRPGQEGAAARLEEIERALPPAWVSLFNGRDTAGWAGMDTRYWHVEEGVLRATPGDGDGMGVWTLGKFRGDVDFRVEARVVEPPAAWAFALLGAMKDVKHQSSFGVFGIKLGWDDVSGTRKQRFRASIASLPKPFDPREWTRYEIRLRAGKALGVVDGEALVTLDRPADREEYHVGLAVERATVEFRKMEILVR